TCALPISWAFGRDDRGISPECQHHGREVVRISRGTDPTDPRVAPEPDPLAACELPGAAHGQVERLRWRCDLAVEIRQDLLVADCLRGRPREPTRTGRDRPDLGLEARVTHGAEPVVNATSELGPGQPDAHQADVERGRTVSGQTGTERGEQL